MKICDLTTEKEAKKHNSCERYSNETRQTFTNYVAQHHLTMYRKKFHSLTIKYLFCNWFLGTIYNRIVIIANILSVQQSASR